MSEPENVEHPNEGGSFIRQNDGSLKRNNEAAPAEPEAKPQPRKQAKKEN